MYLRMLKRDLKDKKGLNAVLFVLMIMASIFMGTGLILLYTNIHGLSNTYKKCKNPDLMYLMCKDYSDNEGNAKRMETILSDIPYKEAVIKTDVVAMMGNRLEFQDYDDSKNNWLSWDTFIIRSIPDSYNIPIDENDEYFTVPDGYAAIPQHTAYKSGCEVGDTLRITTDYGNVYEFIISDICKNPSTEGYNMIYLSEHDAKLILSECPNSYELYEIVLSKVDGNYADTLTKLATAYLSEYKDVRLDVAAGKGMEYHNDGIISIIVSITMVGIAVFMVLMIIVTIHFSLRSTIKQEEKEIGIMKAIGVYSFTYKALFAVKYLAFAVVGGLIGLPFAKLFSEKMIGRFVFHTMLPSSGVRLILLLLGLVFTVLFIVFFTILSLRRMNKISVMDAIHGENRGERFKRLPGLLLYKSKRAPIPFFLALSDILKKIKRYIYLILAFFFGAGMILTIIIIKDSLCSRDYFMKYWQIGQEDFHANIDDEYADMLIQKSGNWSGAIELINQNFEDNGIPAKIEYAENQAGFITINGEERSCDLMFGLEDASEVVLVKGTSPVLPNEIAMPYRLAKENGLEIGDKVTISYDKYNMNHVTFSKQTEDFVITGYFEAFGTYTPRILLSSSIEDVVATGYRGFSYKMDCDPKDYDRYFNMMDDLYTDDQISFIHNKDIVEYEMGNYLSLFNILLAIIAVVVVIVVTLLTTMYETIFIDEEISDIALLKSMGLDRRSVRLWHGLRMILLSVASVILSSIVMSTLVRSLLEKITANVIRTYSFDMPINILNVFVIVPAAIILLVALVVRPALKPMDKVQIWRVNNE